MKRFILIREDQELTNLTGHCEGAVTATVTTPVAVVSGSTTLISSATVTTTHSHDDHDHDHEDEDHDHEAGATESLAPSPTASIGCEPHGDHCKFTSNLPSCYPSSNIAQSWKI